MQKIRLHKKKIFYWLLVILSSSKWLSIEKLRSGEGTTRGRRIGEKLIIIRCDKFDELKSKKKGGMKGVLG